MKQRDLDEPVRAVRAGKLNFNRFALATREYWERTAGTLYRRWDKPLWVEVSDVHQDLLLHAWRFIPKVVESPENPSPGTFVAWNARNQAQKRLQAIRCGGRRPHRDKGARSMYEIPFSTMSSVRDEDGQDPEERLLSCLPIGADQLTGLVVRESLRRASSAADNLSDRLALAALAATDGDADEAAARLYEHLDARLACRLDSERDAVARVRRAILRVPIGDLLGE